MKIQQKLTQHQSVKNFVIKEYDKNKRVRRFQTAWRITDLWVDHIPDVDDSKPGVMFCATCRAFQQIADRTSALFTGCSNMRVDPLKKPVTSAAHIKASPSPKKVGKMSSVEKKEVVINSPIVQATNKISEIKMNTLVVMFNTAYALAKKAKPLSDYETVMELHVKNRKDIGSEYIDIGHNYLTEKSAKQFVSSIASQIKLDSINILQKSRCISVLADGSTDFAMTEQYTVLVRCIENGFPVTKLASILSVESANADGVLNGINEGPEQAEIDKSKIVCANFDGPAVMMGHSGCVCAKKKMNNPKLIGVH